MKFSVITANYNGERYLDQAISSVLSQRNESIELEYILVDGKSTDGSLKIIEHYRDEINTLLIEADTGPANALNKGFSMATGDIISWLNADDIYYPGTLQRAAAVLEAKPDASFCFGKCPIIDEQGEEIRYKITRFKELFFPISSRFVFQSINYVSQPSLFFRRQILDQSDFYLREDMVAAWDYEWFLRLWHYGNGVLVPDGPLAAFRWHSGSISGQYFRTQFKEELDAAIEDAGRWSLQAFLHRFVRWGIVSIYTMMEKTKNRPR